MYDKQTNSRKHLSGQLDVTVFGIKTFKASPLHGQLKIEEIATWVKTILPPGNLF